MKITLKGLWCGHMPGSVHSVSDARALHLMLEGIAEPDKDFIDAHQAKIDGLKKKIKTKKEKKEKKETSTLKKRIEKR